MAALTTGIDGQPSVGMTQEMVTPNLLAMALCDSATNASIPRRTPLTTRNSQPCRYGLTAVSALEAEDKYHADKSLASPCVILAM